MSSAFCPGLSVEKECLWTKLCLSFSASPRPLNFDPLSAWALCNPSLTAPPRVGWRRGTDPLIYCPITATPTHSFPHPTSAHAALSCFVLFFFAVVVVVLFTLLYIRKAAFCLTFEAYAEFMVAVFSLMQSSSSPTLILPFLLLQQSFYIKGFP